MQPPSSASMSPPTASSTLVHSHKSTPICQHYIQGRCRYGDKCKKSHDIPERQSHEHPPSISPMGPPYETSDTQVRSEHGATPCRAWKAGNCTRGSKCWFRHDIEVQEQSHHQQRSSSFSVPFQAEDVPVDEPPSYAEYLREQVAEVLAAQERENAISLEEASKSIRQLVFDSIVTYSAGLDVSNLITGFETCTLRVRNLPSDVKEDDIHAALGDHGMGTHHFRVEKKSGRVEALVVTDVATGQELAANLDGVEIEGETVEIELTAANSLNGMSATTGQASKILTISWRAPSAGYVAEYVDIAAAEVKVKELDRCIYRGRCLKVEMNTQPPGRFVRNLARNAIRINNLPSSITDQDIIVLTDAISVKRLGTGSSSSPDTPDHIARLIQEDIKQAVPGGLKKFDDPPSSCNPRGIFFARAHFSSLDDTHIAYACLLDKRYGNQPIFLQLPDPMQFTIPVDQYNAQKAQWDSLAGSIKDEKACTLTIRESGEVVVIRLSGSVKEATSAVENLVRGEKVEGWHRSLGITGNLFAPRVYSETSAYLCSDWKRRSLTLYGMPDAIDRAREMIKKELEWLASLDHTVTLAPNSVEFFVKEGIQQLKETLGENNIRFVLSSRKLIVSGSKDARHVLDRLVTLSRQGSPPNAARRTQACPICYNDVSSPHQLGCGHTYCVDCLRNFISSAESEELPLVCLGDETRCRVPIAIPTIERLLPQASFNQLLEAAFDAYIAKHPKVFKRCRTPGCTQIYRAVSHGIAPQTLRCPSCFSSVCNGCHEDAHDGLSCAKNKAKRMKKCPKCKVPIKNPEGNNHMTCRCGAHICWQCMGIFTADTIYGHLRASHAISGDGPAVPESANVENSALPDVREQREVSNRERAKGEGKKERRKPQAQEPSRRPKNPPRKEPQSAREQRPPRQVEERRKPQQAQQNRGGDRCAIM